MDKCKECGLWKESDNGFLLVEPSDCHDKGGHYMTRFTTEGEFDFTDRPWQVGGNDETNLTPAQMLAAMTPKALW